MSIGLAAAYARATTVELLRHPGYVIPTLVFPAMFFLFFAAPHAGATSGANWIRSLIEPFSALRACAAPPRRRSPRPARRRRP